MTSHLRTLLRIRIRIFKHCVRSSHPFVAVLAGGVLVGLSIDPSEILSANHQAFDAYANHVLTEQNTDINTNKHIRSALMLYYVAAVLTSAADKFLMHMRRK